MLDRLNTTWELLNEPFVSGWKGKAGEILKTETGPPLRLLCRLQHDGGGMLFLISGTLYTTFPIAVQLH